VGGIPLHARARPQCPKRIEDGWWGLKSESKFRMFGTASACNRRIHYPICIKPSFKGQKQIRSSRQMERIFADSVVANG
jgi:hypothetical protein